MTQARLAWALLVLALSTGGSAQAAEVVAHPGYAGNEIPRSLLRGVFGMRVRTWPDGTPVRVFVLADEDPAHQEFAKAILQMYPYQLRQNWDRLLYSGTGQPPVVAASEQEVLQRVAMTPGGIGYVSRWVPPPAPPKPGKSARSPAPAPARPAVKVLHVR